MIDNYKLKSQKNGTKDSNKKDYELINKIGMKNAMLCKKLSIAYIWLLIVTIVISLILWFLFLFEQWYSFSNAAAIVMITIIALLIVSFEIINILLIVNSFKSIYWRILNLRVLFVLGLFIVITTLYASFMTITAYKKILLNLHSEINEQ